MNDLTLHDPTSCHCVFLPHLRVQSNAALHQCQVSSSLVGSICFRAPSSYQSNLSPRLSYAIIPSHYILPCPGLLTLRAFLH